MSSGIILDNKILNLLDINNQLCILKHLNKNNIASYYFGPSISIKLWSPKVSWLNANSCSFQFKKYENLNLLTLLRNINSTLVELYSLYKESRGYSKLNILPCIFYEKDDFFYIKCNMPYANRRYSINIDGGEDNVKFSVPRIGMIYKSVILDIRNIWEVARDNKVGFKLELKNVELN
jgi:hypothetical protein